MFELRLWILSRMIMGWPKFDKVAFLEFNMTEVDKSCVNDSWLSMGLSKSIHSRWWEGVLLWWAPWREDAHCLANSVFPNPIGAQQRTKETRWFTSLSNKLLDDVCFGEALGGVTGTPSLNSVDNKVMSLVRFSIVSWCLYFKLMKSTISKVKIHLMLIGKQGNVNLLEVENSIIFWQFCEKNGKIALKKWYNSVLKIARERGFRAFLSLNGKVYAT